VLTQCPNPLYKCSHSALTPCMAGGGDLYTLLHARKRLPVEWVTVGPNLL